MFETETPARKLSAASLKATEAFLRKPQEYVVHNATPDDIYIEWHAEKRVIPAYNRFTPKHPRWVQGDPHFSDVPHSAQAPDGTYIPGTLIFKDIIVAGDLGSRIVLWSAAEAIQNKLGIDPDTGEYNGAYALRGLSLLPREASPEQLAEIAAEGRARWEEWEVANARQIVIDDRARVDAHKQRNLAAPPPQDYVERAAAFLKAYAERTQRDVKELLYGPQDTAMRQIEAAVKQAEASAPTPVQQPPNKYDALATVLGDDELLEMLQTRLDALKQKRFEAAAAEAEDFPTTTAVK